MRKSPFWSLYDHLILTTKMNGLENTHHKGISLL